MSCFCDYPIKVRATSLTVAGGVSTVTLPATVTPMAGFTYDIILSTPIPEGTEGTQISITNGTVTGTLYWCTGNYKRAHNLSSRTVIRAQFFDDPAHFLFIPRR